MTTAEVIGLVGIAVAIIIFFANAVTGKLKKAIMFFLLTILITILCVLGAHFIGVDNATSTIQPTEAPITQEFPSVKTEEQPTSTIQPTEAIISIIPEGLATLPKVSSESIHSTTNVYTGPGTSSYRRDDEVISTGTDIFPFFKKSGWVFISYYSPAINGTRYGWVNDQVINNSVLERTEDLITTGQRYEIISDTDATDGPNDHPVGVCHLTAGTVVNGLISLDDWIYCTFTNAYGQTVNGFISKEKLRETDRDITVVANQNSLDGLTYLPFVFSEMIQKGTDVYLGPGENCSHRGSIPFGTNVYPYGKEGGWVFVSYYGEEINGTRYGWITDMVLSNTVLSNVPEYNYPTKELVLLHEADATDGPNDHPLSICHLLASTTVTAEFILNDDWIYCSIKDQYGQNLMGFIPVSAFF